MIICTTSRETALLVVLLESMTIPAERVDAPAGASIFLAATNECLALFDELELLSPIEEAASLYDEISSREGAGGFFSRGDCS